jgi:hypothetical protein
MTWWDFVQKAAGADDQATIARKVGVQQSMISRWRTSVPRPENAAAFARAYGRPVLEAFIAAGFLTSEEAGEQPSAPPSLASMDDDDLLDEVRARMKGERGWSATGSSEDDDNPDDGGVASSGGPGPETPPAPVSLDDLRETKAGDSGHLRRAARSRTGTKPPDLDDGDIEGR